MIRLRLWKIAFADPRYQFLSTRCCAGTGRDVVAEHRGHPPGLGDVAVEAVRLVLRQHDDLEVARVDDVAEREVDEPVDPSERHRGFGPVGGEGHQSLALSAGEDDGKNLGSPASVRHGPTLGNARPRGDPSRGTNLTSVRVDILTKEYPPNIYGGAGVHVAELVRALRDRGDIDARVRAFGEPVAEEGTTGYADLPDLGAANAAVRTMGVDLAMAGDCVGADLVHSHTWYANFGGHVASLLGGMPHVVTAHSLEPMRPWKAEQLGGGYRVSSFMERTAYEAADAVIAVSEGMRQDVLRSYPSIDPERVKVVHNGIDSQLWQRHRDDDTVRRHGVDPDGQVGHLRRADHPPEGPALPAAGGRPAAAGRAARAVRRRAGHPRDHGRGRRPDGRPQGHPRGRRVDPRDAAARGGRRTPLCCNGFRLPVDLRAARHRQPRGDGVRAAPSSPPRPAASPRSSSTARPAGWCRSSRSRTAAAYPSTPDRFVADLAAALTDAVSDPARADRMGLAGRAAGRRLVLLGDHRRADQPGLPRRAAPADAEELSRRRDRGVPRSYETGAGTSSSSVAGAR